MHILFRLCVAFATTRSIIATPVDPGPDAGDRALERRNQQVIFNPCPEFLGGMNARQSCQSLRCGGDTKIKGVCDKLWLGGLQDDRCYQQGGCGSFCLCVPDSRYANGPSVAVQFIGIECPEAYGNPKQKCSDPKCGGNVYFPGFCDNILVSGAQGPGCPRPGCGQFCQCDPTDDTTPKSSGLPETATSFWLTGTTTETPTGSPYPSVTGPDTDTIATFISIPPDSALMNGTAVVPSTTAQSSLPSANSSLPSTTSGGGGRIPIIPILPPPPPGFLPPPVGLPNPTEQCPANYQDLKCSDCGGQLGYCLEPPYSQCPCEESCTSNDEQPDCNDEQCAGEDGKCTIGPQKDCECMTNCPEGIDGPRCDDNACAGNNGECTEGANKGCDCIVAGTAVAQQVAVVWVNARITILNSISKAYLLPTPMSSTASSSPTQTPTTLSTTTQSCWTSYPYLICRLPEETTTTSDGHVMSIMVMETTSELLSSAPTPTSTYTSLTPTKTSSPPPSVTPLWFGSPDAPCPSSSWASCSCLCINDNDCGQCYGFSLYGSFQGVCKIGNGELSGCCSCEYED